MRGKANVDVSDLPVLGVSPHGERIARRPDADMHQIVHKRA